MREKDEENRGTERWRKRMRDEKSMKKVEKEVESLHVVEE